MERNEFDEFRRRLQQVPLRRVLTIVLYVILGAALLVLPLTMFYTVDAEAEAVVLRFGKYYKTVGPGLKWKLPFGIDRAYVVATQRMQKLEFGVVSARPRNAPRTRRVQQSQGLLGESQMLTGDLKIADVRWSVQYLIARPFDYLFKIASPEATLSDACEAAMRLVVGDYSFSEVLTDKTKREKIQTDAKEKTQELMDLCDSGIDIVNVLIQVVDPPSQNVKNAFAEVSSARLEKKQIINEANQQYNKIIPEARGQADKMVLIAEGEKVKRVNEAAGDVARFSALLQEYTRAKEVTRTRLYLEALSEVLPQVRQIFVLDESQGKPLQVLDLQSATGARSVITKEKP